MKRFWEAKKKQLKLNESNQRKTDGTKEK